MQDISSHDSSDGPDLHADSILERIKDGYFSLNQEFCFTNVNGEGERLLQVSRDGIIGRNVWDIFASAAQSTFCTQYCKAFNEQIVVEFQEYFPPLEKWFDVRVYPSHDGISVFFHDITEIRQGQELSATLNTINTRINSTLDFDEKMQMVMLEARIALKAESALILFRENDCWFVKYTSEIPEMAIGMRFTDSDIPFAVVAADTKEIIAIDNAFYDSRTCRSMQEKYNLKSVILIPLFINDRIIGILCFNYHSKTVVFTDKQLEFGRSLGILISMALENVRLSKEIKQEARKTAALESISEAGILMLSLNETLRVITERISIALDSEYVEIIFIDETSDGFDKRTEYFKSPEAGICMPLSEEIAETIFYQGKPVEINDIELNKSLLGSPLIIRGSIIGAAFACSNCANKFDDDDTRLFNLLVDKSALIIDNVNLYSELIDNRTDIQSALEREKNISHLLERALMPEEPYINDQYEITAAYLPAYSELGIGGDFYDVFTTEDGCTGIIIGDVSGKGVEAASLAVATRSTVRAFAYEMRSSGKSLVHANDVLYEQHNTGFGSFVTVFLAILDTATGNLIYSSAGHPPAVIRRRDGAIEILDASQPPLGVVKSQSFYEMNTILNVGDKILLYTDGILEARKGGDIFGLDGINEVLRLYGDKSIHYIVERMIDEAQKWDGGRLRDDAALVVIERV